MKYQSLILSGLMLFSVASLPSFAQAETVQVAFWGEKINEKSVDEIYSIYSKKNNKVIFIDVREPSEWEEGVIPNAKKISLGNIEKEASKLDKNKEYVLVCRSGRRSLSAYDTLKKAGFKKLTNFKGGMLEWYSKSYPVKK